MVFLILYLKACWRRSTVVLGLLPSDSLTRVIDLRRIARCRRYSPPTSPAQPYAKSVRYDPPMAEYRKNVLRYTNRAVYPAYSRATDEFDILPPLPTDVRIVRSQLVDLLRFSYRRATYISS